LGLFFRASLPQAGILCQRWHSHAYGTFSQSDPYGALEEFLANLPIGGDGTQTGDTSDEG